MAISEISNGLKKRCLCFQVASRRQPGRVASLLRCRIQRTALTESGQTLHAYMALLLVDPVSQRWCLTASSLQFRAFLSVTAIHQACPAGRHGTEPLCAAVGTAEYSFRWNGFCVTPRKTLWRSVTVSLVSESKGLKTSRIECDEERQVSRCYET